MGYNQRESIETELMDHQIRALKHALKLAAELKYKHADAMVQCAVFGGNAMISVDAARQMAKQHTEDAVEFKRLERLLEESTSMFVLRED